MNHDAYDDNYIRGILNDVKSFKPAQFEGADTKDVTFPMGPEKTMTLKGQQFISNYSLPLEGGIEAAYRAEIDAAADPGAKLKEIEDRLNKLRSPFRSAEKFWVEEIIDPGKTRSLLCEFARLAEPIRTPGPTTNMKIRP